MFNNLESVAETDTNFASIAPSGFHDESHFDDIAKQV
jgi:hypothetical protein